MARPPKEFRIWQWNCWGFTRKKTVIQQFIRSHFEKPHVILLQEMLSNSVLLPGYTSHALYGDGRRGICTLVSKGYTISQISHDLSMSSSKVEHSSVEIIPGGHFNSSVFILYTFSSPNHSKQRFAALLSRAATRAGISPLGVEGDLNAPHQGWVYLRSSRKGEDLWQAAVNLNLTLATDLVFLDQDG